MSFGTELPYSARLMAELIEGLSVAAVKMAADASRRRAHARRKRVGDTRRPGPETPLWNSLVKRVRPRLEKWGSQANLGRVLGVPRQRVHDYFVRRTRMPDAEGVLHVMLWLTAEESSLLPGHHAQPLR